MKTIGYEAIVLEDCCASGLTLHDPTVMVEAVTAIKFQSWVYEMWLLVLRFILFNYQQLFEIGAKHGPITLDSLDTGGTRSDFVVLET